MKLSINAPLDGTPDELLNQLWTNAAGDRDALQHSRIDLRGPLLPSVFRIEELASVTTAAAGLAAAQYGELRGVPTQQVHVDSRHAQAAFLSERYQRVDGEAVHHGERNWGYYETLDGRWMQLHVGFPHHHRGHMELLGCTVHSSRDEVAAAVAKWRGQDLEDAMAARILPGVKMRARSEWASSEQGQAVAALPLLEIIKIGDAPPLPVEPLSDAAPRPLGGVRVLDVTKVIAGPVCGRTLAEHGADVLRVHAPRLPFMPSLVIDTGRGKRSCHLDLAVAADKARFSELLRGAHVMTQGYRPGAIAAHGFAPEQVAALRPGIVCLSLCAWSHAGPWSARRGFDSLVQMASGIADAGSRAANAESPRPLPCQALDHATGYLAAFGVLMALARQRREGGSWNVRVSLAQTGEWLHRLGALNTLDLQTPDVGELDDLMDEADTPFGRTRFIRPVAQLQRTPAHWARGSVPLGHDAPEWLV